MLKIIIASLLFTFILGLSGCGSQPDNNMPPVAGAMEVSPAALPNVISTRGVVESVTSRDVYSMLPFMVERIYVVAGDYVMEGQVLARLDTTDLELNIAQKRASLESSRQSTQNSLEEAQRVLSEATVNLSNNTNIHIINAQASLTAAEINLETAQRSYENALNDYMAGTNAQIINTESSLLSARIEMERLEADHANVSILHNAGIMSQDELRQVHNALTHARNQYNDARINYENARESERRFLDQQRSSLQSAISSRNNAQEMLNALRVTAQQDIERLRGNVASAQISANLETMEISLQLMERQLEDSVITAPISGAVTNVIAREGATGSGLLFVIEDTDNLKITTSFREYDVFMIEQGMEVLVISAANVEYTGVINRINHAASLSSPIVEFEAEILITSTETDLRIGMVTRIDMSF